MVLEDGCTITDDAAKVLLSSVRTIQIPDLKMLRQMVVCSNAMPRHAHRASLSFWGDHAVRRPSPKKTVKPTVARFIFADGWSKRLPKTMIMPKNSGPVLTEEERANWSTSRPLRAYPAVKLRVSQKTFNKLTSAADYAPEPDVIINWWHVVSLVVDETLVSKTRCRSVLCETL